MIAIFADFPLKSDKVDEFLTAVAPLIKASNEEEGCIRYELHKALNEENTYLMIEEWKDQAAIDFHNQTEHFTTIVPLFRDMLRQEQRVVLHSKTL